MEKLKWIEIKYDVKDFDRGVLSQGAMVRRFKDKNPDLAKDVRADGSFKIDHQTHTVSMRIGVVDRGETNSNSADSPKPEPKLLQSGYDELLKTCLSHRGTIVMLEKKYDALVAENDRLILRLSEMEDETDE